MSKLNVQKQATIRCRLCDGEASISFCAPVLNKYEVGFYGCQSCDSLQAENPYWLAEGYSNGNLASIDTFAANRAITNLGLVSSIAGILNIKGVILDYGGGDGLLTRLLRDAGYPALVFDEYAAPSYAAGFSGSYNNQPELVTAFEVLEHLVDPQKFFDQLFRSSAVAFLATTQLYSGQGTDWYYLTPGAGTHIFFYSTKALQQVAEKYGWHYYACRNFHLFLAKPAVGTQRIAIRYMSNVVARLISTVHFLRPQRGYFKDSEYLSRSLRNHPVE